MPPKAHLHHDHLFANHFNILSGYVGRVGRAGVKVVGDYVDNSRHGLPSELALLMLYEPRTGAVICAGVLHLAKPQSRIVGDIGARGTAFMNLRLLAHHSPLEEMRINSARPASRERLAALVCAELGLRAVAVEDPVVVAAGADIVIEATRLTTAQAFLPERAIKPGALLVTYGWVRAVDPGLPHAVDMLVADDWAQCSMGGQLHDLIAAGSLREEPVHLAEVGEE